MSTEQPEALRLADRLDLYATGDKHQKDIEDAAAELRRLSQVNAELLEALIVARQEAICWYAESRGFDPEGDKHPDWLVQSEAAIAEATKE
jgi:hypothetical protein